MEEIKIKSNKVINTFFSYSKSQSRVFNCNEIFFQNLGMATIIINDTFYLLGGQSIYIRSLNNEIDETIYKFNIEGTILQGWYKMIEGTTASIEAQKLKDYKAIPPNRMRTKNKAFYTDKKRK